jgi:dihydroorotate dehydrogenase (fumarate)
MDLSTKYLGLDLPHPFMSGACPLTQNLDGVRKLEDAGTAAIVMHSLFEEQIIREEMATAGALDHPADSFAEALSYFPKPEEFALGSEEYLTHLKAVKEAVSCPVIGSLNGTLKGGWVKYAKMIAEAGADALELNVYSLPSDPQKDAAVVEARTVELIGAIKESIEIPVAVKLSPFYSSLPHFAHALDKIGADGLVLFNRLYQPDIDIEALEVERKLTFSHSGDLLPRLRWLAILSGTKVKASLAVSGGVHTGTDAVKAVMTGADVVQIVSALLISGPEKLTEIRTQFAEWVEKHEYKSMAQLKGSMNLERCPDASAYERANYMRILRSWESAL